MRLPWLQIDTNVFPRLDSLAGLLKISQAHAYGLAAALWAWAIDWGPSDSPPTGEVVSPRASEIVSAGLRWDGDPDILIGALRDIGLIADIDGGLRVKGMSRYAEAWSRQDKSRTKAARWRDQKRKWRSENEGQTADKARTSARQTSKTETETETETEKEEESLPVAGLQALWNAAKPPECSGWQSTPAKRRTSARARLTEQPDLAVWAAAIKRAHQSPFLRGHNDRGWVAGPEWLLKPDSLTRLLEGGFDGKTPPHKGSVIHGQTAWTDADDFATALAGGNS